MSPILPLASAAFGLLIGSFLGMLIPRLHFEEDGIFGGRSHCLHCKKTLSPLELIPLLSFLIQKGRCHSCSKKIPFWYPAIELSTAALFFLAAWHNPEPGALVWSLFLFSVLIFIFFYDLRFKEIHDLVMLPAILLALLYGIFFVQDLSSTLIGLAIGFSFFALQYLASQGRWIGSGDMRIGAFMGAMLGFPAIGVALFLSYILGSVVCISLLAAKLLDRKQSVPLGPFLVVGTLLAYFFSDPILHWFLLI